MWNCPAFQAEVKRIFEAMAAEGFDRIFNYQNEYAERIRRAAQSDAERWKSNGYGNPDMDTPLAEVQKQLRDAINSFGNKLGLEGYTKPEPIVGPYLSEGHRFGWMECDGNIQIHRFGQQYLPTESEPFVRTIQNCR